MKLILSRQLVDVCQVVLLAMAALSRSRATSVGDSRQQPLGAADSAARRTRHPSSAVKPFCVLGLQLLTGLGLPAASAMAQETPEISQLDSAASWNLTETTVVNKGQSSVVKEGEMTRDIILESKATATNPSGSVVPVGTFKVVMSAFSPAYDQRGQKKGIWYVWGKWTLTDVKLQPAMNARHRAGEISGQLSAELTFNPMVSQQNWTAKVRLPMTRIAPADKAESSQPARGEGALTLDGKREGKLSLNLRLWPTMQQ